MQFQDPAIASVLSEYEARYSSELSRMQQIAPGEMLARRDEFLLPVGTDVGWFLHSLVVALKPRQILELGTSYGYSTLFLAAAAREFGGKVVSVDVDGEKQAYAADMLAKAGLGGLVEFRQGDAIEVVAADPGPFDFVLLDIWKDIYVAAFEAVYPKLSAEGVVASDNMISPFDARPDARALRSAIQAKPDLQTTLLPIGQGIELTVKWAANSDKL